MSDEYTGGPLDVATLDVLAQRAAAHPLVDGRAFEPESLSPRRLELPLDDAQYPPAVDAVRLDVRWFEGDDYTIHYLETRDGEHWQCRWDRHPKPGEPSTHFHPPPDAATTVDPAEFQTGHHLGVLFGVLDWVSERIEQLHEGC